MMWSSLFPARTDRRGSTTGFRQSFRFVPASRSVSLSVVVLVALCVGGSMQQQDPIQNFCRRFGHQSAIVDDRLYIDGGLFNYGPIEDFPTNYTNPRLSYHDLTTITKDGMPPLKIGLNKNDSVPDVQGGILWPDPVNKRLYLFGGEFFNEPPSSTQGIYAYDILYDHWDLMYDPLSQPASGPVARVAYGAGVSLPDRGEGYYYGGWSSNATDKNWGGDAPPRASSFIVKYEMDKNLWTNSSGPDGVGRAEGSMVHVPAGDAGLLVYFGGVKDEGHGEGNVTGQPMDEIFVYEVLSQKWYTQKATGDVPGMRRKFCSGVVSAPDQSSYNIYLYGGADPTNQTPGYDDLYILSLPSFHYIKIFPDPSTVPLNETGGKPHHSLTCDVYNSAQMLIIGGTFPMEPSYCDNPPQLGVHNVDLGKKNDKNVVWELFDPQKEGYQVPDEVYNVIGGGRDGGATKTEPEGGWAERDLGVLMARTASVQAREPTRDVTPGGGLGTGPIAGIAIGGAVALAAVISAIVFFCLRRRRRTKQQNQPNKESPGQQSSYINPSTSLNANGMHTPSHIQTPSSPYPPTPATPPAPVELPLNELHGPYYEVESRAQGGEKAGAGAGAGWIPQVSMVETSPPYGNGGVGVSPQLSTPRSAHGEGAHSPVEGWHARHLGTAAGVGQQGGSPGGSASGKGSGSQGYGSWSARSETVHEPQELMSRQEQERGPDRMERVHQTYYHP